MIKRSLCCNYKSSFCPNIKSIFIGIFLPKSKFILVDVLYRTLDKPRFIQHLDKSFKESNVSNIQECCLMGDLSVNLSTWNKILLEKKYDDSHSQAPVLVKEHMDLCFSHFLYQLIAEPRRTTEHTERLIDHILTYCAGKVI